MTPKNSPLGGGGSGSAFGQTRTSFDCHLMIICPDYSTSDCHDFSIPETLLGNVLVPDGKTKAVLGTEWSSGTELAIGR